ncbi:hypothetical protein F3Y22_tig00110890pilonHSYRG00237 [Hibiscus syriacus]|uniref:Uncharacterized protein n=1 Tax=Hibiscus syriacus TaxID=106335 RepID=A0A6A2ZGZ2_HIBSY|nr:hypothetical protein F3Y22_tig00110890pilonHSYRG00237 [Hibiscus syriacus]
MLSGFEIGYGYVFNMDIFNDFKAFHILNNAGNLELGLFHIVPLVVVSLPEKQTRLSLEIVVWYGKSPYYGHFNKLFKDIVPKASGRKLGQKPDLIYESREVGWKAWMYSSTTCTFLVLHQGDDVVLIPGTTKIKNLDSNIESVKVKLTKEDLKEISDVIPTHEVGGPSIPDRLTNFTWKTDNTPPKKPT